MPGEENEDKALMLAVMHYLDLHPNAADTLEGIRDWWLTQQHGTSDMARLERILEKLVMQRQLVTLTGQSGKKIYKRSHEGWNDESHRG